MNQRDSWIRVITGYLDLPGRWVGKIVAWVIIPMMLILVYEVTSRYVFTAPTVWVYDITYMLYGALFMLGAAYALGREQHVRADFLYNTLPVRWQAVIDLAFYIVLFFPALGIFTVNMANFAASSWASGERITTSPWLPIIYPLKTVMPVCGILLLIQGISESLKSVHCILTNQRFRSERNG